MTTFAGLEVSLEGSRPIELYEFRIGATVYPYTSDPAAVVFGGVTYESQPIERGAFGQGAEDRKRAVQIIAPASLSFAAHYISVPSGDLATVTVYRMQRDETPSLTRVRQYRGDVNEVQFTEDGALAQIQTRTAEAFSSRQIPRYTFAGSCQHVLFGPGCNVSTSAYVLYGTVTSVGTRTLTIPEAATRPDGYFRGGILQARAGGDWRLILKHVGAVLTLQQPFIVSPFNVEMQLLPGCDHVYGGDCSSTRYGNQARNGGFPWVPTKNPFATGVR